VTNGSRRHIVSLLVCSLLLAGTHCGPSEERSINSTRRVFPDLRGPYLGQEPPGPQAKVFAPGVVSLPGRNEFYGKFSPSGNEFYFGVYSEDTPPTTLIMEMLDGRWSQPRMTGLSSEFSIRKIAFSPDGSRLYFAANHPTDGSDRPGYSIWYLERSENGWGVPRALTPATDADAMGAYPVVAADGTIYASARVHGDDTRGYEFYSFDVEDGTYRKRKHLGDAITRGHHTAHPYIDPDQRFLLFASARPGGFGSHDLYVSFRDDSWSWSEAMNLGDSVNTAAYEDDPWVSIDGRFLFFYRLELRSGGAHAGEGELYWIDADVIRKVHEGD